MGEITLREGGSCPSSPAIKKVFRLVVVGSAQAGKSAIVNRFLNNEFEERYIPTIENFHRKLYKIRGELFQLDIVDCSGNDPFPAARKLTYSSGDMFLIVGAVDQEESIPRMLEISKQIAECKMTRQGVSSHSIPILYVVNKVDLPRTRWQIDYDEVCNLVGAIANSSNSICQCSALTSTNIESVFGRIFAMAKLPKFMNPELHKALRNELSADGLLEETKKKKILQRMRSRFSREDDEIYTDMNARRPSLRTDLLMNRAKTAASRTRRVSSVDDKRCTIS
ncbi:Dexamethasone-induced Ras-related protein 1 [Toxocara canis]|uniref:Dexamethasone-induced Ras-related protein 1 n=2 Tax=Toxocara canis TaxID=6265 RepID=A0A0B2VI15_TOXCA|nr:Dexamethasone-induced Ras-related protein 1 [Toxocara canis]VDM43169.1 unnamed protein product [Toxocara canis]